MRWRNDTGNCVSDAIHRSDTIYRTGEREKTRRKREERDKKDRRKKEEGLWLNQPVHVAESTSASQNVDTLKAMVSLHMLIFSL